MSDYALWQYSGVGRTLPSLENGAICFRSTQREIRPRSSPVLGLRDFRGLAPSVGATLAVALNGTGTRPAPTFSHTPRIPKEARFLHSFQFNGSSLCQTLHLLLIKIPPFG